MAYNIMKLLNLSLSHTALWFPFTKSAACVWDAGGPWAGVSSGVCGGQSGHRAGTGGSLPDHQPQFLLILVHWDRLRYGSLSNTVYSVTSYCPIPCFSILSNGPTKKKSDGVYVYLFVGGNQVDAIHVTQLERDTVLVCLDSEWNNIQHTPW